MAVYFAYGANLDVGAMKRRCPASRPLGLARLRGFEFFISANGYASIRRKSGAVVHGLMWDLSVRDVPALDRYEAVGAGLYLKRIESVQHGHRIRSALVYVARPLRSGEPVPGYMESVLAAAEQWRLPEGHLRDLRGWLPGGARLRR